MTQLMMWKRDGVEEFGIEHSERWVIRTTKDKKGGVMIHELKSSITDLQPAKAVPIDEITISKELWKILTQQTEMELSGIKDNFWQEGVKSVAQKILFENPHLVKPEPMKEPTNFGAIVEANEQSNLPKQYWIKVSDVQWQPQHLGFLRRWSDLINPVLVSEGVK